MVEKENLPLYPIRTVARLTGINDRTLRSWESKYGLVKPARTRGGHRLYSENDIKIIREIKEMVYEEGMSITGVEKIFSRREGSDYERRE